MGSEAVSETVDAKLHLPLRDGMRSLQDIWQSLINEGCP